jgi:ADP-heptose:LPS heptosyltransferase
MKKIKAKKIAVFRALQLGDMLCAVPALRALRHLYPSAEITLIGLPWANEFVQRFNTYIDRFISFPGYKGLPEQKYNEKLFIIFINTIRKERYDLLIQLQGDGSVTNTFITLFGAKNIAGSFVPSNHCPDPQTFIPYQNTVSEAERNLSVVANLGNIPYEHSLEFPIFPCDLYELSQIPEYAMLKKKQYICIHPGARDKKRRWNYKHFANIANYLMEQGYQVVFTGVKEEIFLIDSIMNAMHYSPINFAGRLSLGATAALLKKSALVISNSTSVSHLADALHVKSIVIYRNVDVDRWAPHNKNIHKIIKDTSSNTKTRVLKETALFLERNIQ